jgi:hypothetical protein
LKPALSFTARPASPGGGAVKDAVFAEGVQVAPMACMPEQLPEQEHCAEASAAGGTRAWCSAWSAAGTDAVPRDWWECAAWLPVMTCMPRIPAMTASIPASSAVRHRSAAVRPPRLSLMRSPPLLFNGYKWFNGSVPGSVSHAAAAARSTPPRWWRRTSGPLRPRGRAQCRRRRGLRRPAGWRRCCNRWPR